MAAIAFQPAYSSCGGHDVAVRARQVQGSFCDGGTDATTALSSEYLAVRDRLLGFAGISETLATRMFQWLLLWQSKVAEQGSKGLPAPWVFADGSTVEFEWHMGTRKLYVTLHPETVYDVTRVDVATGADEEVQAGLFEMPAQLLWVLGG